MKRLLLLIFLFCAIDEIVYSQSADEKSIRKILQEQTESWNKGNIEQFVKDYWRHDSLMFIGQSGITYGFQNTLNNYKKNYADTIKMGKLAFEIIKVQKLSGEYYFVVGKWFLRRSIGDLNGLYTLLFRKMNGKWVIVADHST